MQLVKRAAAISMSVCAIAAVTVASASALPELLPGTKGTTFTGKSGKGTLQIKGGPSVTCSSTTGEGELTGPTTGKGTIDFKGCTSAGLPLNSLGDTSGTVLISGETSICYINKAAHTVGVVTHIPASGIHIEVPSVKLLLVKKGGFILQASPVETKTMTFTGKLEQKEGKQSIEKCEGGEKETILVSTDGGAFIEAGLEAKEDVLTFEVAETLMA